MRVFFWRTIKKIRPHVLDKDGQIFHKDYSLVYNHYFPHYV
jgi:hypothetical protein